MKKKKVRKWVPVTVQKTITSLGSKTILYEETCDSQMKRCFVFGRKPPASHEVLKKLPGLDMS